MMMKRALPICCSYSCIIGYTDSISASIVHLQAKKPILKKTLGKYTPSFSSKQANKISCTFHNSVPFIVRGPGIRQGHVSHVVSSHTDLASTFLALANQDELIPEWLDGGVIPLTPALENHPKQAPKESFAVEFWGNLYLS